MREERDEDINRDGKKEKGKGGRENPEEEEETGGTG